MHVSRCYLKPWAWEFVSISGHATPYRELQRWTLGFGSPIPNQRSTSERRLETTLIYGILILRYTAPSIFVLSTYTSDPSVWYFFPDEPLAFLLRFLSEH